MMEQGPDSNLSMAMDLSSQGANLNTGQTWLVELRVGDMCPKCHQDWLDYDGLLNLACPACGYAVGGGFT
jgi:Zn finger protein HypA/HybF involved in hydrogenase expression